MNVRCLLLAGWACAGAIGARADAVESPPPPPSLLIERSNSGARLEITPYPAADEYRLLGSGEAGGLYEPLELDRDERGFGWTVNGISSVRFFKADVQVMPPDELLGSTLIHRIAYGPTPDVLERLRAIGPDAYLAEQLTPESIEETLDVDRVVMPSGWEYVTVTGNGSSSTLYVYLTSIGEGYLDDLTLVRGTVAEQGPNLIRNGGFELPLDGDWTVSENLSGSEISTEFKRSGNSSLKLVATSAGTTRASSIYQTLSPGLSSSSQYTLSFWYLPRADRFASVTVRLSGSGVAGQSQMLTPGTKLGMGTASIEDLQMWHLSHAIESRRQLLETLLQFFDNHFTTYLPKSREYIDGRIRGDLLDEEIAVDFEYRELTKWRDVLLNPNGTFYDLLRISAESPAMIIYLDTVTSNQDEPNENYSRELMELFTMGVDNGYDQRDIEEMSRAWSGWRVYNVGPENKDDPHAPRLDDQEPGYWTFNFRPDRHDRREKVMFEGRTVDDRFGPPYAGRPYELRLPARMGREGIQDGYDILAHLADLPYTQEYISVKLCQLFVHDQFHHGYYDYTDPELSAEGRLIRDCMAAWEEPGPDGRKGNLRKVLAAIFNSELFRTHAASRQKVKTPIEYVVSALRVFRAERPDGSFTANARGLNLVQSSSSPLRALGMRIFHREDPDGWPEDGRSWINTSAMVERMRFVQALMGSREHTDPAGLIRMKLPETTWRDAGAIADFFLRLAFPGEGRANLVPDREALIGYLNTTDAGAPSPLSGLDPESSAYEARIRSAAAFLLCLPRFNEQ